MIPLNTNIRKQEKKFLKGPFQFSFDCNFQGSICGFSFSELYSIFRHVLHINAILKHQHNMSIV